jgi:hypothetical protein
MWLAAGGAIRAHWTNQIHDEWMRNVARDFGVSRSVLERVRQLMDRAAGDALIRYYRHHERLFPKTDPKDRHVAAAALAARKRAGTSVVTIVTWNVRDFNRNELSATDFAPRTLIRFCVDYSRTHRRMWLLRFCACVITCAIRQRRSRHAPTPSLHKV